MQSAKAAGYGRVIAITTTLTAEDLDRAGADIVVEHHGDIPDALATRD